MTDTILLIEDNEQNRYMATFLLERHGYTSPVCVVVHPIFAGDSYDRLVEAGAGQIVSTNTIAHASNVQDLSPELAAAAAGLLAAA